jgi:transposase
MSEDTYDSPKSIRTDRIEVVTRSERRRRWSDADKQRILQETLSPGATVAGVAQRHEIGTGQIYTWRRQALVGALGGFMPVRIGEAGGSSESADGEPGLPTPRSAPSPGRGVIVIELASGIRLRVGNDVDGAALRCVLAALEGR